MKTGFLLALEGIDGSGKSTAAAGIASALRAEGEDVAATREPTDGPWGRRIRAMAASAEVVAPEEELRWFVADRREHVAAVLRPALEAGRVVVTDRYFLSTVAYQGARGLDWRAILADAEREFPIPNLALRFELEPVVGLSRTRSRGGATEPAFEEQAFLERVAAVYRAIERPWLLALDASVGEAALLSEALDRVRPALHRARGRDPRARSRER